MNGNSSKIVTDPEHPLRQRIARLSTMFKTHFKGHLHFGSIRLIALFISALCKVNSVNYSVLAAGCYSRAKAASCFRRMQRLMAGSNLTMETFAKSHFQASTHQR
jgi:hypothetical protein